jgi:hypothetical protein
MLYSVCQEFLSQEYEVSHLLQTSSELNVFSFATMLLGSFKVSYLTFLFNYCMTDAVNAYLLGSNAVQGSECTSRTGWAGEGWTPAGCPHTSYAGQTGSSAECAQGMEQLQTVQFVK